MTRRPVRRPHTSDDLDTVYGVGETPDRSRATVRQLEAWAAEGTRPGDEVNAARLLTTAAELLGRVGDAKEAVRLLRRAVATGEPVEPDVRCYLHHALLEAGDADGARAVADEIRHERPADGDVYLFIGEDHELRGDLREAHRWLTLGVRTALDDVDDAEEVDSYDVASAAAQLLIARRRVRRELGMPPDEWDDLVSPVDLDDDAPG